MLKKPNPIRLSSVDKAAPPGVQVVIRLQYPVVPRPFTPAVPIADYSADEIERAQAHSDELKRTNTRHEWVTWWRKNGKHVHKMPTLMEGRSRSFRVRVPYKTGVSDAKWKEYLQKCGQSFIGQPISVAIDNAGNRQPVLWCVWEGEAIVATGTEEECEAWASGAGLEAGHIPPTYRVRPLVFGD